MSETSMRLLCKWPTAPGNAATILLFATHPKLVGSLSSTANGAVTSKKDQDGRDHTFSANQLNAVELLWNENDQASNANGVRIYTLKNDLVTWREVSLNDDLGAPSIGSLAPKQVPILTTPAEFRLLLDVARYTGLAIEYTAGATGPTAWSGQITAHINVEVLSR